jgi:signal transduction histidine kinase
MRHDDDSTRAPQLALGTGEMEKVPIADDHVVEIVHDFKSPLATISLEMSLLQETIASHAAPAVRASIARIARNVAYIDRLVRDLLDSSSIDAGELSLQRRPTELCSLLRLVIDRSIASRDRARIYLDVPDHVILNIDAPRIERVIANMLSNALKYGPATGGIIVRLERLARNVRISVIDGGAGVDDAARSLIFNRFMRTLEARSHEGSGLGLYVSRKIVEAHGGSIGADQVAHVGSRFFFELPA